MNGNVNRYLSPGPIHLLGQNFVLVQHFRFLAGEHVGHTPMSVSFLQPEYQLDTMNLE